MDVNNVTLSLTADTHSLLAMHQRSLRPVSWVAALALTQSLSASWIALAESAAGFKCSGYHGRFILRF